MDLAAKAVGEFALAILHGDQGHRDWLIGAAEAFIAGKKAPKKQADPAQIVAEYAPHGAPPPTPAPFDPHPLTAKIGRPSISPTRLKVESVHRRQEGAEEAQADPGRDRCGVCRRAPHLAPAHDREKVPMTPRPLRGKMGRPSIWRRGTGSRIDRLRERRNRDRSGSKFPPTTDSSSPAFKFEPLTCPVKNPGYLLPACPCMTAQKML
jgi:hypothetical protein